MGGEPGRTMLSVHSALNPAPSMADVIGRVSRQPPAIAFHSGSQRCCHLARPGSGDKADESKATTITAKAGD